MKAARWSSVCRLGQGAWPALGKPGNSAEWSMRSARKSEALIEQATAWLRGQGLKDPLRIA